MKPEQLALDHVVLGVADLDEAAAALLDDHGLVALPGGRHPQWGTANRIVPLGASYLELVAVADPDVAATSAFGSWVADMAAGRAGWGWAVRTADIATTVARLGLAAVPGSRVTPLGVELRWQLAGVPGADTDRRLPFFIEWGEGVPQPGLAYADHPAGDVRVRGVTVETDAAVLGGWLDYTDLPVTVRRGRRGVVAVELMADTGRIVLEPRL
jgi:catechol 2,3-dioxygenase-like lactoylglutathione lyase family enzyme